MRLEIPEPGKNSIFEHLNRARDERDLIALLKAARYIVTQGRVTELLYGLYCAGTTRPSQIQPADTASIRTALRPLQYQLQYSAMVLTREELIGAYGSKFAVDHLPDDFVGCRTQAIVSFGSRIVLGEYAPNSARIAIVSASRCVSLRPYVQTRGVRHIHLVCATENPDELFVTTGDARKVLDRVSVDGDTLRHVTRHRTRFAGYTACAFAAGEFFFGTDFSGRPNYIETLAKQRYFFPAGAYRTWVKSLTPLTDRHLVAVTCDFRRGLHNMDGWSVCVFDAVRRAFVLCEAWFDLFPREDPCVCQKRMSKK